MDTRTEINKLKRINKFLFYLIVAFWIGETVYFGWNDKPINEYEKMCDNIVKVGFVLCVAVYIGIPPYDDRKKGGERYFLIKYSAKRKDSGISYGNLWFNYDEFPTNTWIKKQVNEKGEFESIVVENIFEFKSKEDFDTFRK